MAHPLTAEHRRQQLALRAATIRELHRLWPALDPVALDRTYPGWEAAVLRLVAANRRISVTLALRYLDRFRTGAGIRGPRPEPIVPPVPAQAVTTSLRVTTLVAIRAATGRGVPVETAAANAFVTSSGAATRHVLDGGREAVLAGVRQDPAARGWQRVTSGRTCDFCDMLAGRGAVYSAESADFASHDHCACSAEPVYA
jgi:hypothetical protein